ncbi:MAG: hypothetical protein U0353_02100 [Sandaracinus sp.]
MSEADERGVVVRSTLAAAGPLERIDRAFVLARRGGLALTLRSWLAGGLPALTLLAYFYVERVEGIGLLRLPAALALVLSFLVRSWVLAHAARIHVRALSERAPIAPDAGGFLATSRTAIVVAIGLWAWSLGILVSVGAGPIGIALFLPLLGFRGLVAPSWLARAGCANEAGVRAFALAARDTSTQRLESLLFESMLILAIFGIAANLWGLFAFVVLVGRSFLGLEMALVDEFLSFRNTFVLLAVTLVAAVLIEPLRAALSAQVYVDARVRAEGLDLRAALDEAIEHTRQRPRAGQETQRADQETSGSETGRAAHTIGRVAVVGLALWLAASPVAHAQDLSPPSSPTVEPAAPSWAGSETSADDAEARERARAILSDDIFRDVEARRRDGLADLVTRLLEWLIEQFAGESASGPATNAPEMPSLPLPGPVFFLTVGVLFALVVAAFLVFTRRRDREASVATAKISEAVPDPRDRSPDDWLGEASALAARERWAEALRALYLATLVALDRRAWIRFEPSLTNWQYLRQMPSGPARDDFRVLTRTFDWKVYGEEPAAARDYAESRALAERILHASRPSLPPPPLEAPSSTSSSDGAGA